MNYIMVDDYGLSAVENGDIFGCIGTSIMMNYSLNTRYKHSLKVMTVYKDSYVEGSIGVHVDEPILLSILNKAVASLEPVTQDEIFDKWIDTRYEKIIDYTLVWEIIVISFILIFISIIWNRQLNAEMKKRKIIEKHLKLTQKDLKELNNSLEKRVEIEIEKNRKHQLIMMEQIKLAQMGEMIENIAHQWRQPLAQVNSSILIIDTVLKRDCFTNEKELIDSKLLEIENLTEYMSTTIDNFQNFFNSNKIKISFGLREIIEKSIAIIEGTLSSNFTKITIDIDKSLVCKGYPSELQQVLVIIIKNANDALKIREVKNPQIMITLKDRKEHYLLSIGDNAGGIEAKRVNQIFEPYYTTKHKSQGRGVGLYMAKMIIEDKMKGQLSVENKNNGACFNIKFFKEKNNEQ